METILEVAYNKALQKKSSSINPRNFRLVAYSNGTDCHLETKSKKWFRDIYMEEEYEVDYLPKVKLFRIGTAVLNLMDTLNKVQNSYKGKRVSIY